RATLGRRSVPGLRRNAAANFPATPLIRRFKPSSIGRKPRLRVVVNNRAEKNVAESRQSIAILGRTSASFGKAQAMLAQFVVQGLAGQAQRFGYAAQRTVRTRQFRGDQRALEGFHLFAQARATRLGRCVGYFVDRLQAQWQAQGETFGGVLQFADIAGPGVAQKLAALFGTHLADRQTMAARGGLGEMLEQEQHVFAALT